MGNNENYEASPGEALEKVLYACQWLRVYGAEPRTWEMGRSRILVDEIGIFLYRECSDQGQAPGRRGNHWVRTAGLSHNRIRHLRKRILKFDGFQIDLLTGE